MDDITLADLISDPHNARKHNPRNVGMLEQALKEVGAARSIVIDEFGVVLAGNATVEAAGNAGIERVRVVEASGNEIIAVKRTGLTEEQKKKLALYDNRVAELAGWNPEEMLQLNQQRPDILESMFFENEILKILGTGADVDAQVMEAAKPAPEIIGEAPPSHVRMVQLFLDDQSHPEFMDMLRQLAATYKTTTVTDTVRLAVKEIHEKYWADAAVAAG